MKNDFELHDVHPQEDEIEPFLDIVNYLRDNNLSSGDLYLAYLIALQINDKVDPEQPIKNEIYILAKKIDKYTRSGLAVDRIRELIQTGSDYEQAVEKCNLMIDAMQLTDKEKSVLKSIVTQKRKGVLEVTDKQKRKKMHRSQYLQRISKNLPKVKNRLHYI